MFVPMKKKKKEKKKAKIPEKIVIGASPAAYLTSILGKNMRSSDGESEEGEDQILKV